MDSRDSLLASDRSAVPKPLAVPRSRDHYHHHHHTPTPDDAPGELAQGSAGSSRTTSSSLSFYPPAARSALASAAMASRSAPGPGRNTSIDSIMSSASAASGANSSLSNVSHSHQSSADTTVASTPDVASFIDANGGPAASVEKLLKERFQQTARSEQLWKLLEKQRAMVHGMHADLEKALKEKERYRKRVKEVEDELERAISSIPATLSSPAAARRAVNPQRASHVHKASVDTLPSTAATPASPWSSNAPPPSAKLPRAATDTSLGQSPAPLASRTARAATASDAFRPDVQTLSPKSPAVPLAVDSLRASPSTPKTDQVTQKLSSPGEKSRKAAPAPLNLSQAQPPAHQTRLDVDSDADDDFANDDDILDVDLPEFERGRRRTRAEDDRQREVLAIAEEMRSRSGKSKSSKSTAALTSVEEAAQVELPLSPSMRPPVFYDSMEPVLGSAELPAGMIAGLGLPSSPRAVLDGDLQLPIQNNSGSIASVLGDASVARNSPISAGSAQTVTLPLKSPGLPMSPKPVDRPPQSFPSRPAGRDVVGPGPMSPRTGLPLSPRAPKFPLPMPNSAPNLTAGLASPQRASPVAPAPDIASMAERLQQSAIALATENLADTLIKPPMPVSRIYKGYASEEHPGLLLAPNAIPLVRINVVSSRLQPARGGSISSRPTDEDNVFLLGVHSRADSRQLWRVEKPPASLAQLDAHLRPYMNLPVALPERNMFSGHAPAKVDARRSAITKYFDAIFDRPMSEKAALTVGLYFSRDVLEPEAVETPGSAKALDAGSSAAPSSPRSRFKKEGYLSKKGKQFGGWKSRWFVLDEGMLKHYANPGGEHLGNIRLDGAQIATQNTKESDEDAEFRHAFMIMEPKRKDSSNHTRHVLCAESDGERDRWVEALMQYVGSLRPVASPPGSPKQIRSQSFTSGPPPAFGPRKTRNHESVDAPATPSGLLAVNYENTVAADAPLMGTPSIVSTVPSPLAEDHPQAAGAANAGAGHSNISGPRDPQPISNLSAWGHKSSSPSRANAKDGKKRSMFGFITRSSDEPSAGANRAGRALSPRPFMHHTERPPTGRPVFGIPLAEAAELSQPAEAQICLPSPVYRCIRYLEVRNAANEEGIFRLSGSNAVVNTLKDRFDAEGDVDLLKGDYIDVHAVASLLKRYLRELPEPILTNEMHPSFAKLSEIEDKRRKLLAINLLVHKLPEANRESLVAVFSYLIKVVNNSGVNKMNVKNVGIVFAPTLHIPTPLVSLFITEHDTCFTPSPLDPGVAAPVLDSLAEIAVPASIDELAASRQKIYASTPNSAGLMGQIGAQEAALQGPDMRGRVNGSFGEFTAPRSLSETRRELRKGSQDIRDAITKPIAAMASNAVAFKNRSRSRDSPSPASRAYVTATPPPAKVTPPPPEPANGNANGNGNGRVPPAYSSASSSPGSFMSSQKGWDSPGLDSGVPTSRKAKRESTMQGITSSLGNMPKPGNGVFDGGAAAAAAGEPRKKSSYTRLKEGVGMGSLRES